MFESDSLSYHKDRLYGLYRAYVYDNKDPQNQGRLKLQIPNVYGVDDTTNEPLITDWAYPAFPIGGKGWGVSYIPPYKNPDGSNVMVWVAFEMGDKFKPVWIGSPYPANGLDAYSIENNKERIDGKNTTYDLVISTPKGSKIILDDKDGGGIIIQHHKGSKIVFDDKTGQILINNQTLDGMIKSIGSKYFKSK